jgi:hypothetical protein
VENNLDLEIITTIKHKDSEGNIKNIRVFRETPDSPAKIIKNLRIKENDCSK